MLVRFRRQGREELSILETAHKIVHNNKKNNLIIITDTEMITIEDVNEDGMLIVYKLVADGRIFDLDNCYITKENKKIFEPWYPEVLERGNANWG